ncbi:TerD family protein [Neobacillus novalis]|uniref:TerD family protein n=1 Tax=Neobacillus novalis TaxID=220687 RepID=A0AA95SAP3_9BACI|nr:TerD family protein [Neobacillus novalis]WHY88350.1 TerD family protein [Neobacillus novalis]
MKNSILLRRKNKLILTSGHSVLPDTYLATALKNIENLGYTFSEELIEAVRTMSEADFINFYKGLVQDLKEMVGAHRTFQPMYPNFPSQVMEIENVDLYLNAIIHYCSAFVHDVSGLSFQNEGLPIYKVEERFPLIEEPDVKVIGLAAEEEFLEIIRQLIAAKTSISVVDKGDVAWTIENITNVSLILPDEIPLKENIGFVVSQLLKNEKADAAVISRYFKTATDVLRLAAALSDGDVSLAGSTRFKNFKRPERRLLLSLLEGCGNLTEDMIRHKEMWKRLGERLHPAEYKSRYKNVNRAFDIIRNNIPFTTFGGRVEGALLDRDLATAVSLLKTRPGEFARRLDHLLRISEDVVPVINEFGAVVNAVATPVLLQVLAHFKQRGKPTDIRVFFPKGNVQKAVAINNELNVLEESVCEQITALIEAALISRFAQLPGLGKIVLDKELRNYLVPFSQRSASKALRTLVRGSKLDMPIGDTIRFFLWWKEGMIKGVPTGRVDIDLSAVIFDENWQYLEHISYTNLRSAKYNAVHSGDITSAPNGACEFIDLDIPSVLANGGRYVVMDIISYTEHAFCDMPECYAGWMSRKQPNLGEIFEPKTVVDKIDVAADTTFCIPVILDLAERKVIWTDLALRSHPEYYNNIEGNLTGIAATGKAMTSLVKPNLYQLFELHARARGELVIEKEEADTIFSVKEGITPFDIEKIIAEYLI